MPESSNVMVEYFSLFNIYVALRIMIFLCVRVCVCVQPHFSDTKDIRYDWNCDYWDIGYEFF